MNRIKAYAALVFVFCSLASAWAQERVYDLQFNPVILQHREHATQKPAATYKNGRSADTLTLPFIDDFSSTEVYPDAQMWMDSNVFINHTYPLNPLSYGVATFDGLNKYGLPHNGVTSISYGAADTLTSNYINLSGLSDADSLYLSFWYESKGLGDYPNVEDSLILEFKINDTIWEQKWATAGEVSNPGFPQFKQVFLKLDNPFYFTNAFQFRFCNYASIMGNNDHWHIDYVVLDENRTVTDKTTRDLTVLNPPTPFLKNYTAMPWNQFEGFENAETNPKFTLTYRNNYNNALSMDFGYTVQEGLTQSPIFTSIQLTNNFSANSGFSYPDAETSDFIPYSPSNTDSVLIEVTSYNNDIVGSLTTSNDTVTRRTEFFNQLAYDDGTAEKAYGLEGPGIKKFAYEFKLNVPDTLRAILIHFTQIEEDVSDRVINIAVWKSLDFSNAGVPEDTLYLKPFQNVRYQNTPNGFTVYELDEPIVVDGTIYIGFEQEILFQENTQIGLDVNNTVQSHMHYYSNNQWFASQATGAPMIRIVLGKDVPLGVKHAPSLKDVSVYPNPVKDRLFIQHNGSEKLEAQVYDMTGRLLLSERLNEASIRVSDLENGIYLLRLSNTSERTATTIRFVKM